MEPMTEVANVEQYEAWNGEGGRRWVAEADRRDRILAPAGDALLAAAALRPGERALDIGCGCGATTLAAARATSPGGAALGLDLSGPMLEVARARAAEAGLADVAFVQGDAQSHDLPPGRFSAAISRFGTMFFADPVAAFSNIASALAPGGRLCLATWQPLDANEWLRVPVEALAPFGPPPDATPGAPGMFGLAVPGSVAAVLGAAGLADVEVASTALTLDFGAVPEAADYLSRNGLVRGVLEQVPDDRRPAALEAVHAAVAARATTTGVHLPAAIWLVTATHPT